ncbi:MAG: regulatory protein RecX [Thiotrichaceae bacterium]|nr:regulatory protein RecX [Thiotrichaceae bacterium]
MPLFNPKSCQSTAIGLLARREHSRYELANKLRLREHCGDEDIESLLNSLEEKDYLSEERYTEMIVRSGLNKGYGRYKILNKLYQSKVTNLLIERYLNSDQINWYEQIHKVCMKKCAGQLPHDYNKRAKLARFLKSRGFENELIQLELNP